MFHRHNACMSRRTFFRIASAAGVGAVAAGSGCSTAETAPTTESLRPRASKKIELSWREEELGGFGRAPIYGIAWSPDGRFVAASGSGDSQIALWDVTTKRQLWLVHKPNMSIGTRSLAFTPNGQFLIVSSALTTEQAPRGALSLIDVDTGKVSHTIDAPALQRGRQHQASHWAISADGKYLAANIWTARVRPGLVVIYDAQTWMPLRSIETSNHEARRLAFDPLTNALATQSINYSPAYPPVGSFPRDRTMQGVEIWNVSTGEVIQYIPAHRGAIQALTYIPGTQLLVTGAQRRETSPDAPATDPDTSELLRVWDSRTGHPVKSFGGDVTSIRDVSLAKDRQLIAAVTDESRLCIWDFESGQLLRSHQYDHAFLYAIECSPVAKRIAFSIDNNVRIGSYA